MFQLGQIVISVGAEAILESDECQVLLDLHQRGEWGFVSMIDKVMNEFAMEDGARICSRYRTSKGFDVIVLTEGDRSKTTIQLPQEVQ